jgi:hypothetical protein
VTASMGRTSADVPARTAPGRPRWTALAVLAVLIGAAAAGYLVTHHHHSYDVSPGTALLSGDGMVLTVGDFSYSCVDRATVVVRETRREVSVLEQTHYTPDIECPAVLAPDLLTVRLHAPLGRRSLIDATTGRLLPWFDQRHELKPGYLPAGYRALAQSWPFWFPYGGVSRWPVCTQVFSSSDRASGALADLVLTQVAGAPATFLTGKAHDLNWRPTMVGGHRAWIAHLAGSSYLAWSDGGQAIGLRAWWQSTGDRRAQAKDPPLTDASLLRFAASLRPPSWRQPDHRS